MGDRNARVAIVGLGRIASLLEDDALREKPCTHTGAIVANPRCDLVGGSDISSSRRELFAQRWGCDAVYEDGETMVRELAPDILVVATHPDSHLAYVSAAARHRVPVVVCEKPLADTVRRAKAIARLHRTGAVRVITNHERRYSADYIRARAAVLDGRYGRVISVRGTLCFGRRTRRDRMLLHDGTHMVDAIAFLLGGPVRFRRRYGRMRSRRGSTLLLGSCEGSVVYLEVGSERDHLIFEIEISFEGGRIRVGNGVESWERSVESPYYEGYRSLVPEQAAPAGPTGYFANMIADALACWEDPTREPRSSALDALEVMRFIKRW